MSSKRVTRLPEHSLVDQDATVSIDEAIRWLASGDRVHSVILGGVIAGADMDRTEIEELIKSAGGGFRVPPGKAFAGHCLAVWRASADIQPRCGYWLFFETAQGEPPRPRDGIVQLRISL